MPHSLPIPQPAGPSPEVSRLAHAGLLPFLFGALLIWLIDHPDAHAFVALALSSYAALILSFLGGIHWGLGMLRPEAGFRPFVWGVAPSLMAWVAVLMPPYAGLVVHGVLLVVCYLVDRQRYGALGAGAWLTLRFRLSALASLLCFLGAAGA